mgnify:CR=1 FL=1
MAINKVVYGSNTLIDLTADTVTSDTLVSGETAHSASGDQVTGTLVIQRYYIDRSAPSSSLGNDGDLYLQS